ncbi:hypothetical protein N9F71_00865, partial [bacterium]|nr:hypothetical protein [bacterium]
MLHIIENAFKNIDLEMLEMNRKFVIEAQEAMFSVEAVRGYLIAARQKIAGSKKMYALLNQSTENAVKEINEITADMIRSRNEKIVSKLKAKEINEIPSFDIEINNGSGNGYFKAGEHNVHIRTILAGGYNIQKLHQRTLTKVS